MIKEKKTLKVGDIVIRKQGILYKEYVSIVLKESYIYEFYRPKCFDFNQNIYWSITPAWYKKVV